jgi:hypothetical protein
MVLAPNGITGLTFATILVLASHVYRHEFFCRVNFLF